MEKLRHKLIDSILDADRHLANQIVDEFSLIYGYESGVSELLEPALIQIGEMWLKEDSVTLAQGYVAGIVAQDVFSKAFAKDNSSLKPHKGTVVIGNIEDDFHSLGRKMVISSLLIAGWQVYDLGNDVLAEEFVNKASETGAGVIGVSAMMYSTAINIRKVRQEIDRRGLNIKLAVGGVAFVLRPELI
jgi:methanogenic corrinoid protein MtbC1